MTAARAPATRSNLVRLRRRLEQVEKGAALLRKKRESLVTELFQRARSAIETREAIERQAAVTYDAVLGALAANGRDGLRALGWPTRELRVELRAVDVWGVRAAELVRRPPLERTLAARGGAAGPGDAPAVAAAAEVERLLEAVLDEAPREHLMRRLGQVLARATRLVNTLEQRVTVDLDHQLAGMRRTLDEREREERLRLKRIVQRRSRR